MPPVPGDQPAEANDRVVIWLYFVVFCVLLLIILIRLVWAIRQWITEEQANYCEYGLDLPYEPCTHQQMDPDPRSLRPPPPTYTQKEAFELPTYAETDDHSIQASHISSDHLDLAILQSPSGAMIVH